MIADNIFILGAYLCVFCALCAAASVCMQWRARFNRRRAILRRLEDN